MFRIAFSNSSEKPIFVQVDPWACLYKLAKGDRFEFEADCSAENPAFSVDEFDGNVRILTLWDCDEFYILRNGERVHWEHYQTNA